MPNPIIASILLLTPLLSGYTASYFFPTDSELGKDNPVRPPKIVFGVIWPILYILLGVTWLLLIKKKIEQGGSTYIINLTFSVLNILLFLWIYVNNKLKKYIISHYIIVSIATLASIMTTISYTTHEPYVFLWIPFMTWITIASSLSYSIAYNNR